jgi:hypothetical protein
LPKRCGFGILRAMPSASPSSRALGSAVVDNPFHNPSHPEDSSNPRHVAARIRPDPIQFMHARGHLNDSQAAAAARFQRLCETLRGGPTHAAGFAEYVDGGRSRDPFGDHQLNAGKQLHAAKQVLGQRCFVLVERICAQGQALTDAGLGSDRQARTAASLMLKLCLDDLSALWGYRR